MRKRKLIPYHEDNRRIFHLSHVPFTFNAGDIDWHCPACDALIFGQTHDEQHYDVLIECHRCRSTLGMPGPAAEFEQHLRVVADNGAGAALNAVTIRSRINAQLA